MIKGTDVKTSTGASIPFSSSYRPDIDGLRALAVLAVLVIAGLILVDRLRSVSALQDCLMTRATNCAEIDPPTP